MSFTTKQFLDDAPQAVSRAPSYSPGDDRALGSSSAVYTDDEYSDKDTLCRGACEHTKCRTYRPIPQAPRNISPETHPTPLSALHHTSIEYIYEVHKMLAELQHTADTRKRLIDLAYKHPHGFHLHSPKTLAYIVYARSRNRQFDVLVNDVRHSIPFFGFINMPPRQEFIDAVHRAGLYDEEVSFEQLFKFHRRAEYLREEAMNCSERIVEGGWYNEPQYLPKSGVFKEGWNFEKGNKNCEGLGLEDNIAPGEGRSRTRAGHCTGRE